jgi:hypothetical protein
MYKVPLELLELFKRQLNLTTSMLDVSCKGGKLHTKELEVLFKENVKLVKLLEDNYEI